MTMQNLISLSTELPDSLQYIIISLDPRRDTPDRLQEFARSYNVTSPSWSFLTCRYATLDSLLEILDIYALQSPIEKLPDGTEYYFLNHSDVLFLMDRNGRIRARYRATTVQADEILKDLAVLRKEESEKR